MPWVIEDLGSRRYGGEMSMSNGIRNEDLPDSPHARQLRAGFPWLTFDAVLEAEFRLRNFDDTLPHTRVNLCLAVLFTIAFSALDSWRGRWRSAPSR